MTYDETLEYLFSALPMYQRIGKAAYKASLDNSFALDEYFGHPHINFKSIHIAGTNGKGSVSHMLASILQAAGYKTGLYTSPHLKDFRERIRINGVMIPKREVTSFISKNKQILEELKPSFFEMTVALAFWYFHSRNIDIAIIETGMGGRLDSTNIINPLLSVITNIGLDHSQFLGNTHALIAKEKAGIIKPGIPVIIGERNKHTYDVFRKEARKNKSPLFFAEDHFQTNYSFLSSERMQILNITNHKTGISSEYKTDLLGLYQQKNIQTVLEAIEVLKSKKIIITDTMITDGLSKVRETTGFRGRWEEIGYNPLIICDTAHNKEGLTIAVRQIMQIPWKNLHFILGVSEDKDIDSILKLLPENAIYYFTRANIPRALEAEKLEEKAKNAGLTGLAFPSVNDALRAAKKKADKEDLIFISGSIFVIAEAIT